MEIKQSAVDKLANTMRIYVETKIHNEILSTIPEAEISWEDWLSFIIGTVISIPIYVCIFNLGYRSENIWKRVKN